MAMHTALGWMALNILTLMALGFYSMQEMACVSFNKIRLQYYVSKGMKRALWLNYLLQHPARLFGTTLVGVNAAMFIGSECARESYIALGLDPDFAVLSQVVLVIIFAELAPMFAARRYAEHVALLGAPLLYATAKLLTPILWSIGLLSKLIDRVIGGGTAHEHIVLNQEDLQKILALQDDEGSTKSEGEDLNDVTRNIFSLRGKDARQVMKAIRNIPALPANGTIGQARILLEQKNVNLIPLYHRDITHIVGIAHPRDLIRIPENRRLRDYSTPPWFITQNTKAIQIIKEFRRSNRSVAIVLDDQGLTVGMITLEDITEEIFGLPAEAVTSKTLKPKLIIDRTFPGEMAVGEFNRQFGVVLATNREQTLAELMEDMLGHHPEVGESVYLSPFELTVKEISLTEVKKVSITTRLT